MKRKKMSYIRQRTKQDVNEESGFTLVEVIRSFLLVMLALGFMCRVTVFSFDGVRKSRLRFDICRRLESFKNHLLAARFDSAELAEGYWDGEDGMFTLTRDIKRISPSLKRITLSINYKTLEKKIIIYKSKYIKEVYND